MPKQKMTLTLDSEQVNQLRSIAGARSLSAAVDAAVKAYLERLRHLQAVDEWLVEMERSYGPVPTQNLEWAAKLVDDWMVRRSAGKRTAV
jgi:predicted transcriptional regulator